MGTVFAVPGVSGRTWNFDVRLSPLDRLDSSKLIRV